MQGRSTLLRGKKVVWIWRSQLISLAADGSTSAHRSFFTDGSRISSSRDAAALMIRSVSTGNFEGLILPGTQALRSSCQVPQSDFVGGSTPVVQIPKAGGRRCAKAEAASMGSTSGLRSLVLPAVTNLRTLTADTRPNALGYNNGCLAKLSTGGSGIRNLGDTVVRYQGSRVTRWHGPRKAIGASTAAGCCNSKDSQTNQFLAYSSNPLVAGPMHNEGHCSTALKADRLRVSLRSKEGTFSNVARVRASADYEVLENLEVAPVYVVTSRIYGSLSARSMSPIVTDPILELRLIHPTAVVHPDALLGEGVEIGAFCTVGPEVKLGSGCKLHPGSHVFGETQIGEKCVLLTGAVVGADIPGHTIIGKGNTIGHHAVVGVKCQDMKYKEGDECFLYIGDNNDIREFASIHRSSKPHDHTVLGNNNLIMGSCHIAHDCKIGNRNIFANGTLLGGHVVVEDLVHTGGAVAVHQFCNIGSYSFLGGGSMVDRDVPMFMMVAGDRAELRGLNLEGMRRCRFSELEVRSIRRAYQKLFMSSDLNAGSMEERLFEMEQNEGFCTVPAVRSMLQSVRDCFGENRRGICRFRHWTPV